MGPKMTAMYSVISLILLTLATGCVSKSTFQELNDHANKLDTDLTELQSRHHDLQNQLETLLQEKANLENTKANLLHDKAALESAHATIRDEKAEVDNANAALLKDKETLTAGNRELEGILAAREDALSKKIAALRQEMVDQMDDCTSHLADQVRQLGERNQQITAQTELLNTAAAANDRLTQELQQLRTEKEAVVQQTGSTYQALIDKMKSEIDNGQITISELKGKLTVNLVDAILFDSGKAEIKTDGLNVLQKVIDILKEVSDKTIRIEGHTDNVPIVGGLAQKYSSNWELAAARAVNVAKFLQERGIDPHFLNAVAHGEYKPVADNDSESGRARNRRIEIVLANQE